MGNPGNSGIIFSDKAAFIVKTRLHLFFLGILPAAYLKMNKKNKFQTNG
jgi:hypothetical protein